MLGGGPKCVRGVVFGQELSGFASCVPVGAVEAVQLGAAQIRLCDDGPHARRDTIQGTLPFQVGFPCRMTQLLNCCIKQQ